MFQAHDLLAAVSMQIIVEMAIQNWLDAGILLGIQFTNATIGW